MFDAINEKIERGQIWYIKNDKAVVGSEQSGSRPAVIVSNNIGNSNSPVVEVVYMTRSAKKKLPTHVEVSCINRICGTLLCEQIYTIDKTRLEERVSFLNEQQIQQMNKCLRISIDLQEKKQAVLASTQQPERTMSIRFDEEGEIYERLNDRLDKLLNSGKTLAKLDKDIDRIMNTDVQMPGIDADYLSEEIKDSVREKVSAGIRKQRGEAYALLEELLGESKPEQEKPEPAPVSVPELVDVEPKEKRKPAIINQDFEDAVRDMIDSVKKQETEKPAKKPKYDVAGMIALRNAGWSLDDIAREYKTSKANVSQQMYLYKKKKEMMQHE